MREKILEAMSDSEPYTASELADILDEPRRTVDHHLRRLEEDGEINKKKHTSRHVSWWVEQVE